MLIAITFTTGQKDLALVAGCLVGACVGFLWFNSFPASIFMGDTGSLGLGGAIAAMAVMTKTEVLLIILGGIFVIEALSVLIQVFSFQTFRKRVFLMAPIHHHFELQAWSETKIILRFWIVAGGVRGDRLHALPAVGDVRQRVSSGSSFEQDVGFSRALRVGSSVWVSATAAIWPDGHVDPDAGVQAERCLEIIGAALEEAGASLHDVVRTRIFLVDRADVDAVAAVHGRAFGRRPSGERRHHRLWLHRPALAGRDRGRRRQLRLAAARSRSSCRSIPAMSSARGTVPASAASTPSRM